jgi:hypothetical protein
MIAVPVMIAMGLAPVIVMGSIVAMIRHDDAGSERQQGRQYQNGKLHRFHGNLH